MAVKLRPLRDQVMVITGASSGIGLAAARAAAKKGASLVLASRNRDALADVEDQIASRGGSAIHVEADVSCREDLEDVARAAIDEFGRIDTWVNNAGVSIWGRLEEVDEEDSRQLFETNFWGLVHGSLIAVGHLKRRGGALINLGSVASDMAFPLQGMYSASKHAVKGFTDALRIELEEEGAPISVTLIKPAAINTPFPDHARNYTDRKAKLPPPLYPPEEVARAILHAAEHPVRDIYVGGGGKLFTTLQRLLPRAVDWYTERVLMRQLHRDELEPNPAGALHEAGRDGRVHGDHPGYVMKSSLYTRASMHPAITAGVLAAIGLAAAVALSGPERREQVKRATRALAKI